MMIDVILSEEKDLTVGMRVCFNQLKINEAKMIRGSWKILPTDERSLTSLGMTDQKAKDLTVDEGVLRLHDD